MVELGVVLREQKVLALLVAEGTGVGSSREFGVRHYLRKVLFLVRKEER
jgi:hypothetical protein